MLISLEVLQPIQPESWFAYLHFFLTHFWLGKSLGCQFKSQLGVIEDFPTVQLRISGKRMLADLGTVLMKKRTAGFSTCYSSGVQTFTKLFVLVFFSTKICNFPNSFLSWLPKETMLVQISWQTPSLQA